MAYPGFIWIFASSAHPKQTVIVADSLAATGLDGVESVDRNAGWLCVFSVFVVDVPRNLQALARRLGLAQLDHQVDLRPVQVTKALHEIVKGEVSWPKI